MVKYNVKDITGLRFGRLVVVKPTEKRAVRSGEIYWLCKCDCGNEVIVRGTNLKSGHTQSCECLKKERIKENARKIGIASRKYFGCMHCGSDKHYAKGLCRSCYLKAKRGTLREKL